ncbi:MAG TPA: hypothetical protein VGS19_15910 [Streptosporangiaceae bacterium]|nr:hypothetical protein [Streptosporangiaceae bacterium]
MAVLRRWATGWRFAVVAATALSMAVGGLFWASPGQASSSRYGVAHIAVGRTGHVGPGRIVHPATSTRPFRPTAAERAARARGVKFLASLPKAPIGRHTTAADVRPLRGPQTRAPGAGRAPTSFSIFKTSAIPAECSGCGQSAINEPDTANSGKFIEQTSNWNMAYTTNGGAKTPTWLYQDPYTLQTGFCCDQTVTYIPGRDRFIYEGLTLGTGTVQGFSIGVTKSQAPTAWCVYHFDASSFGMTAGDLLDYPKIAYDNNNLFITWNTYDPTGASWMNSGLARMPLDSLASCAGFGFNYLTRTDNFTFGLTYGNSSLDTFYWVSDWYTASGGSGSSERIFSWADNSGSYSLTDVAVAAYNFAGGSCASADGVVTNWCTRLDPRWETAWISRAEYNAQANAAFAGDTILGVSITAGPGGGDPFPYVIYEYFKLNSLGYVQTSATFNDGFAFAFPSCAPNLYGYVGCAMSFGGGTGTTHYFPGGVLVEQDNINPTQPWAADFNLFGAGNATAWGDYSVTQPFNPAVGPWITTEWSVNSSGVVVPEVVIFGRGHDANGYNRWKSS